MENIKLPAHPTQLTDVTSPTQFHQISEMEVQAHGFTKLELASLMIAQGILANSPDWSEKEISINWIAENSVKYAKAILQAANL